MDLRIVMTPVLNGRRSTESLPGRPSTGFLILIAIFIPLAICALYPLTVNGQTVDSGQVLTLEQAVDIALRSQPSISAAKSTVRSKEATIGQARANYFPEITGSASYNKNSPASSGASSGKYDQYSSGVGLNQMLFDFGRTPTQVQINKLNTQSSEYDLSNTENSVVFDVKQAFYSVLQAQRNRNVVNETVKQFQQHLEQARGFYDVGIKSKIDVTKAEVDLGNARLNQIKAENQVRLSRVTLNRVMGVSDAPDYALEDNLLYSKFNLSLDEALAKVYAQRPDLQALIKRKEAAKEAVSLARKGYFPTLSGSAGYNYNGTEFPLNNGWNYGVSLSMPVFSGFETRYKVAEAQANYDTVSANEQTLRLTIFSDVQQAFLSLHQAEQSITAAELTVRQARENVDLANGRYQAGVGSPLEVTDALVNLNNAQLAYTQALTEYKIAQASIEKVTGVR